MLQNYLNYSLTKPVAHTAVHELVAMLNFCNVIISLLAQWLMLLLHTYGVLGSNLGLETSYIDFFLIPPAIWKSTVT
jgi:hypothetical protein